MLLRGDPDAIINSFFIVARSLDVRSPCWCGRPSDSGGRHVKGEHVNDAAQGAVEDVPQGVTQDLGFRARAARALLATPPPPPPCLCAVRAEMGAQLGSSVAFGSGCGRTLPGVPRKAPLCLFSISVIQG